MMWLPNHLDSSTEVLFAKAFLLAPGRTRGFVKLKGNRKGTVARNVRTAVPF